jgi:hypothetical protein
MFLFFSNFGFQKFRKDEMAVYSLLPAPISNNEISYIHITLNSDGLRFNSGQRHLLP